MMKNAKAYATLLRLLPLLCYPGVFILQSTPEVQQQITVSYSLAAKELSLNEPVVLSFVVQNNLAQPFKLDLGRDRKENFVLTVVQPDGTTISPPPRRKGGFGRVGLVTIDGGQQYRQKLLLNEWVEFTSVGKYDIEVHLAQSVSSAQETVTDELFTFRTSLMIRPRDPADLQEVCASLARQVESATSYESAAEPALALSYIRDPVAVPYLEAVLHARRLVDGLAIDGLERIANEDALRVLISALSIGEPPETAPLARAALQRIGNKTSDAAAREAIRKSLESTEARKP